MSDAVQNTLKSVDEKAKKGNGKVYKNVYLSELYINRIATLAKEYDLKKMQVISAAIERKPLLRNSPELINLDIRYEQIILGFRKNLTQLDINLHHAKESEKLFSDYTKEVTFKKTGKKLKAVDLAILLAKELRDVANTFIFIQKLSYEEDNKRLLNLVRTLPCDKESRLPKKNSRAGGSHKDTRLFLELDTTVYSLLLEHTEHYFNLKAYDNEDDNMNIKSNVTATVAQLLRELKQEKLSYGFNEAQINKLDEIARAFNNEIHELNLAKERQTKFDIVGVLKMLVDVKNELNKIKNNYQQEDI